MDLRELFITALMPVLEVLLITALGAFLALDRFDFLGEDAKKHLNNMVFYVFGPALYTAALANSITFSSMIKLWFMPINILLTFIIGTVLGWLLVKITRTPAHLQGLVLGCCAAGNVGNLIYIIVLAICKERSSPFGNVDVCYKNGLAYAALSMAIGAIYMWSYAYNVVRIYSCKSPSVDKVDDSTVTPVSPSKSSTVDKVDDSNMTLVSPSKSSKLNKVDDSNMTPVSPSKSSKSNKVDDSMVTIVSPPEVDPENPSVCSTGPLVAKVDSPETNGHLNQLEIESTVPHGKSKSFTGTKLAKIMKGLKATAQLLNLKVLLAPSTIGSFVGLLIGAVPQFRKMLVGNAAPLRVVHDSISMLGDAAIPSITLLVGANLLKGLKQKGTQVSLVAGIIVVRYIALPVLGVGIVKGAIHFGWISPDPIYRFILLLEYAVPPAINMGTITQIFGAGESECSVILLATYAIASVSLTLWCTFFMWLVL